MCALTILACAFVWEAESEGNRLVCVITNCPPVLYSRYLKDTSGDFGLSASLQTLWAGANSHKCFKKCVVFTFICPLGARPNVSKSAFLHLSVSYHWLNTYDSLSYSRHIFDLPRLYFPTLSDLATLPLFHCFNSIIDVHNAQFTSWAFSIISRVNPLTVPAALSTLTLLVLSLHQPDAQPLRQITPIYLSVQHSARVKLPGMHFPGTHLQQYNIRSEWMDWVSLCNQAKMQPSVIFPFPFSVADEKHRSARVKTTS